MGRHFRTVGKFATLLTTTLGIKNLLMQPPTPQSLRPEAAAKAAYLNAARTLRHINKQTFLANEFVLGTTGVRADLAVFDDVVTVVEFKTARDTLRRLDHQLAAYRKHCGRIVLVVAARHLKALKSRDLQDIEIWQISTDGNLDLFCTPNKNLNGDALPLLTQAERRKILKQDQITQRDAAHIIGNRFSSASKGFWSNVGRSKIKTHHLDLLSRFRPVRELHEEHKRSQEEAWDAWNRDAMKFFQNQQGAI